MANSSIIDFKGFLSFLILHELSQKQLCGEDLAKRIGRRKQSQLTPGTIYPALKHLRNKQLISYFQVGRKKIYSLTPAGKNQLEIQYILFSKYFWGLKKHITKKRKETNLSNNIFS